MTPIQPFSTLVPYIVGKYHPRFYFNFTIYSDQAPRVKDLFELDGKVYEVESVTDDTDDEEKEQGLSYSMVFLNEVK